MRKFRLACVIEKDDDGYIAYCPQLQGCYVQGDSYEEAVANLRDAMKLHIEDRLAQNESVPSSDLINLTSIEVTA
jgi:predicted RNase H-like HicB family nuclease